MQGMGMWGTGMGMRTVLHFSSARLRCPEKGREGMRWGWETREEKDIKMFHLKLLTCHQAYGPHAEQRFAFANQ